MALGGRSQAGATQGLAFCPASLWVTWVGLTPALSLRFPICKAHLSSLAPCVS